MEKPRKTICIVCYFWDGVRFFDNRESLSKYKGKCRKNPPYKDGWPTTHGIDFCFSGRVK